MTVKKLGRLTNVSVSRQEVQEFKARWPCSELPDESVCFQFDSNGDLVDLWPNSLDGGAAVVALLEDCRRLVYAEGGQQ